MFESPRCGLLTVRGLQQLVKRCDRKAGLLDTREQRRYHPYSFLHGYATKHDPAEGADDQSAGSGGGVEEPKPR